MRYIIVMVLLFLFGGTQAFSQNYELGPYLGGANYIGDVGSTNFIDPNGLVVGGLVKWNQSNRHSFRFSILYAELNGDDARSHDNRRKERGYAFSNQIWEASLGLEFTFWEYDPYNRDKQSTPYLYTGINFLKADHFKLDQPATNPNAQLQKEGTNWEFSIPMILGYKETLNSFLSGGIEIGARYTFTDNLDGSKPSEFNSAPYIRNNYDFGNRNTSDWYMFTGVYLTFNFGRKPCYNFM